MVDDVYLDDHERAERVKQWWKQNAPSIIGGAVLGLGAIFGWRAWQSHQLEQAQAAATEFQRFTTEAQALSDEEIAQRVEMFRSEYGGTPYAAMAAMEGALLHYRNGRPDEAASSYEYAIEQGKPSQLRDVARLRLARLQVNQGRLDAALATLDRADSPEFSAVVDELRGDVLVRMGRTGEARTAYESAREASLDAVTPFLDLKISSLESGIVAPESEEGA